ncbi:hypothetical protein K457DRAFT_18214 [Linnemannia elongata AG-77]|uniref:Rho-GAP domain-containing protein n=1 Tax=Linnemannia elongata AG-77 TaxID=1314771 RepID=A0A197K0Z1_9FUNG|nr:hypothetical protein K457DRAFT_18214 [Linnemannia elongata AG-77]
MFRLVNKRLAANRELQSLKQEFNQCSLPIEFVYRIVVSCVDEIMERGLNHTFILKNPYSPSVVAAMVTLMADPERRDLFSLKCTRIDTVAGVMLAVLKNLPNGAFSNAPSGASTPTATSRIQYKINTVNALLNHPNFPAVNRALLIELLNLSLAILNRSSFNRVKPDMLASILGPHIFASQHATILQHTPQQTYSFGWGVALVNDIKRCSKMFYVLLGGYRREVLGPDEWEFENGLSSASASTYNMPFSNNIVPLSAPSSGVPLHQWPGSTATIHGGGTSSVSLDFDDNRSLYFGQNSQRRLHQSVPHLRIVTESVDSPGGPRTAISQSSKSRYGMVRNVSTTLTESIRAAAAEEAKGWNLERSNSGSKGPAALEHLRSSQHHHYGSSNSRSGNGWAGRQRRQSAQSIEQRHQELYDKRYRGRAEDNAADELSQAFRRHNLHHQAEVESETVVLGDDLSRHREEKRLAIEQMIRECRGTGLNFAPKENEVVETPTQDQGRNTRQYATLAFY